MLMSQFPTSMEVTVPDQSYDLSELLFHLYRKMIAFGVYFRTKVLDCRFDLGVKGQGN